MDQVSTATEKARINMEVKDDRCHYCQEKLTKWTASDQSTWGPKPHLVCFNDDCSYYKKGWIWMLEQFQQKASYRFRYDPNTGESGPLPVWSPDALKTGIVE